MPPKPQAVAQAAAGGEAVPAAETAAGSAAPAAVTTATKGEKETDKPTTVIDYSRRFLTFQPSFFLILMLIVQPFVFKYTKTDSQGNEVQIKDFPPKWTWMWTGVGLMACWIYMFCRPPKIEFQQKNPWIFTFVMIGLWGLVVAVVMLCTTTQNEGGEGYQPIHVALQTASTVGYGSNSVTPIGQIILSVIFAIVYLSPQALLCWYGKSKSRSTGTIIFLYKIGLAVTLVVAKNCFEPKEDFGTSLYFAFTTLTTVGYGDYALNNFVQVAIGLIAHISLMYAHLWDTLGYLDYVEENRAAAEEAAAANRPAGPAADSK